MKSWSVMRHIHTEFVVMGDPGITWSELSEPSSHSLFEHHLHLSLARHPSPEGREGKCRNGNLRTWFGAAEMLTPYPWEGTFLPSPAGITSG